MIQEQEFNRVREYIQKMTDQNSSFTSNGYQIMVLENGAISFSKNNYTLGTISRGKGVVSLAKNHADGERTKDEIVNVFKILFSQS